MTASAKDPDSCASGSDLQGTSKPIVSTLLWSALGLILSLPVLLSLEHLQQPPSAFSVLIGSAGLVLVLFGLAAWRHSVLGLWLAALIAVLSLLIRSMHFGLVDFSGTGFAKEFFIHLEWQSAVLAWQEHARTLRRVGILFLLFLGLFWLAACHRPRLLASKSLLIVLVGVGLLYAGRSGLPETDLWDAWRQWSRPVSAEIDSEWLNRFEVTGLVESEIYSKSRVTASAGETPINLILVYVESLGRNLAEQTQWPDLMPNYQRLLQAHGWVDSIWTSAYITVEGLTNSMCGTLFPFKRNNDSMAAGEGIADELPCLGDVLDSAGYSQLYLGGARMSFAGKGVFLAAHGYQDQRGLTYWREQGLRPQRDTWGLSDADLFNEATREIVRLREEGSPFNLTLLTIGTHLPGYRYEECESYPHSEDSFLQSLHCTDQLLSNWIDELQASGLLRDTLLVITADHHVFPNPQMRSLFGDSVYDRRLPLIVIGQNVKAPALNAGAAYDLAPTLLDLLDIEHDARFILGRSLAKPNTRPDYFVTRYRDIASSQVVANSNGPCSGDANVGVTLPLSRCDKDQLFSLLDTMVELVSAPLASVRCGSKGSSRIDVPAAADQALRLWVDDVDETDRFTFRSRPVSGEGAGLYTLVFDEADQIVASQYFPVGATTQFEAFQNQFANLGGERIIAVWKPPAGPPAEGSFSETLPWLIAEGDSSWVMWSSDGDVLARAEERTAAARSLSLDLTDLLCGED